MAGKKKQGAGRPSLYDPKYCKKIIDYFAIEFYKEKEISHTNSKGEQWTEYKEVAADPRFLSGFARSIGIDDTTLDEWAKKHPECSVSLTAAKNLQIEHKVTCALKGLYNSTAFVFSMKNMHGWRDVYEHKLGGKIIFSAEERQKKLSDLRNELLASEN